MASVLSRAREEAMRGGGGEWLDNDTLIANQLVFFITDVKDDRGGGYNGQDRWLVRVEPFYDGETDPEGLISLTDNPARRKFMLVIDKALDDLQEKGEDPVIGPCVLVRLKGKNYRYIEIVDWNDQDKRPDLPQGVIVAGARVEDDMRPPRRPRSGTQQPEPEQAQEERRPFAGADAAKGAAAPDRTEVRSQHRVDYKRTEEGIERVEPPLPTAQESDDSSASPGDAFPPIKKWAKANGYNVPEGRGRVSNEVRAAYAAAKEAAGLGEQLSDRSGRRAAVTQEPQPYQGNTEDVERELAVRAAQNARPDVPEGMPATAPTRSARYDEAPHAQEIKFRAGMAGTSIEPCPSCGKHIHDRIFPVGEPGSGEYALVHARCEAGGDQQMMPATPDQDE